MPHRNTLINTVHNNSLPHPEKWGNDYDPYPKLKCIAKFDKHYEEAKKKAVTAMIALSIAKGLDQKDIIKNTFYYYTFYKVNKKTYRNSLRERSAVLNKIFETNHIYEDQEAHAEDLMFYIWYLRQIPSAAQSEFKSLKSTQKWKDCMEQAEKRMREDKDFSTVFGFDPARGVQKLDWNLK